MFSGFKPHIKGEKMKKWFDSLKDAKSAQAQQLWRGPHIRVFKKKHGRNKGRFYVGSEIEFINLSD